MRSAESRAPPLLPPDTVIETTPVLKAVIEARAAVAALDRAAQRMPNPAVLIDTIPILEAQASSEIENIVTTTDELFRFAYDDSQLAGSNSDLMDLLFEQPYCRISTVIDRCAVSRPTATKWLNELATAGVLIDVKLGRERLVINEDFLDLLVRPEAVDDQPATLF